MTAFESLTTLRFPSTTPRNRIERLLAHFVDVRDRRRPVRERRVVHGAGEGVTMASGGRKPPVDRAYPLRFYTARRPD